MERGFYHADRGYWQTTGDVPDRVLANYPVGTVEVPTKPGPGTVWDVTERKWVPGQDEPTYPTLKIARAAMVAWIDELLTKITGLVPQFERDSWPSKAEAARAFIAGTARPDQNALIANEALTSGRTDAEVAAKIVAKADAYEAVIGQATGLRVKLDDDLEAATDPFEYETILENGKSQAIALAEGLGINITTA